jgi:hypothetical protein
MELVEVKIKGLVITTRYGTLTDGTILRTNAEFAKHLVEEHGSAEYIVAKVEKKKELKVETVVAPVIEPVKTTLTLKDKK